MDLISKGMYPGTLEIDKDRKTDYNCSHCRRVWWRLLNAVFQQDWYCVDTVKAGGKDGLLGALKAGIQLEP